MSFINRQAAKRWAWFAPLVFLLLSFWGCNSTDPAKVYMDIKLDSTWLTYDSIRVTLKYPATGAIDTIFHGPVTSVSDLNRVEVNGYHGEKVTVVIVGFKNAVATEQVSKEYDGTKQETIKTDTIVHAHPKLLVLKPDSLILYQGGQSESLYVTPTLDWAGKSVNWKSLDTTKAQVSALGVVTPRRAGVASIVASANDSVKDTVQVRVVLDPPVLNVGAPDTTVLINTPVIFKVHASQAYGFIKSFAWDLDGDGKFEDSLGNYPASQKEFSTTAKTYTALGTVVVRFRVRDGEGNADSASLSVKVTNALPLPSNVNLISLSLSTGPITPVFNTDSLAYRSFVFDGSRNTTVTAVAENAKTSVSINSGAAHLGTTSANLALNEGTNLVNIKVIGQDAASSRIYKIIVTVPPNLEPAP